MAKVKKYLDSVAPRVGAWIETYKPGGGEALPNGRAPRGRVD